MADIWLTSDFHMGHKKMAEIRGFLRPLQGEEDRYSEEELSSALQKMDETLIDNFNARVKPRDTVYHLGDFAFCKDEPAIAILKRLHGHITLIQGNHDKKRKYVRAFSETYDLREIKIDKQHGLCPISWEEFRDVMMTRTQISVDHHGEGDYD